ncbi:hypothetical protein M408DRAFT_307013 [Serendipita vermifera MAFF 305830]|uniref:F-box domain-containing protein n=1 Tax=Serendipita vermifera MAFF 305830 TaxID=933852 RepID=A0A0C3A7Q6_SERVB|nr:hypothetical protein M408DRAFT_307013 [Serendipita vermifera MAFF 305830]
MSVLSRLPLEILAEVLSFLDLYSLLQVSQTSTFLASICSDDLLNPWRRPLERILSDHQESDEPQTEERRILSHLSNYSRIPKQNWVHVLALSAPEAVLFMYDVPWLPEEIWHQAFLLRFLPSWTRWKRYHSWKRAFLTLLWRIYHRLHVTCTAEESWTNYVILSRQGIVNLNAASSRQYNPHAVLNEYKAQNNLTRQPSTTRLILQLADVRIIAIGTLGAPTSFQVNRLAKEFVHPEGVYPQGITPLIHPQEEDEPPRSATSELASYSSTPRIAGTPITRSITMDATLPHPPQYSLWRRFRSGTYSERQTPQVPHYVDIPLIVSPPSPRKIERKPALPKRHPLLTRPRPIQEHRMFPNYTPGDHDLRWPISYDGTVEESWIGPMLVTALLVPHDDVLSEDDGAEEVLKRIGAGRSRWASFTIDDLDAIAPWLDNHIDKRLEGMGLGI